MQHHNISKILSKYLCIYLMSIKKVCKNCKNFPIQKVGFSEKYEIYLPTTFILFFKYQFKKFDFK